ncbi:sarcosine oxidase subunit gamma [Palleronia abyssalis]|nr:sarcosine oxidase subunit gamma family protein [Palleronia abyssalis]
MTALQGDSFAGYVTVSEDEPRGMIQLRGDLDSSSLRDALQAAIGCGVPDPLAIATGDRGAVAWMSPDELLLLTSPDAAAGTLSQLSEALGDAHHLALDVSDMRAAIRLEGAGVREVLAKVTPIDMATMTPGTFRRTRLSQIPAAVWLSDERTAHVLCFRSVGRYAFDVLAISSRKGGEVGAFQGFRAPH